MPQVSGNRVVHQHLQTNTVGGEVTINLNLTITINQDGTVQVANIPQTVPPKNIVVEKEVPEIRHAIPEFETTDILTNFGEDSRW